MNGSEIKAMPVSELSFDVKNPRLVEFGLTFASTETEVLRILWDAMDVAELTLSIAASGFFSHEPMIVAQERGKYVVIEGNRRLAAVKLLLDPALAAELKANVPAIGEKSKKDLQELPTLLSTREAAWRYLGFKHVNGPARWSSYAKAKYIADVHRNFGVALPDIANQIGDTHRTVQRLYRGLMVVEEAERMGVFSREDCWNYRFYFSHLYASLERPNINEFLGLEAESEEISAPVPVERKEALRQLCLWLYGSKKDGKPPVIRTQNPHIRYLDAIVGNLAARAALRSGSNIDAAYAMTIPSSNVFEDALVTAKQKLEEAHGKLSSGYDGSEELLRTAGTAANLADDLYEQMERKHTGRAKPPRLSEAV